MGGGLLVLAAALGAAGLAARRPALEENAAGVGYLNQYLYAEAAAAFRRAAEAEPGFDLARVNLAVALFYKQEYDAARRELEAVAARQPDDPRVRTLLGLIAKNQGDLGPAVEHFRKVTAVDPTDAAAFYHLGVTLARLGRAREAEAALRRGLELDPANTSVLYNLGSLLLKSERADEGRRLLERFRALQQKGEGSSIGNQYGEAGRHALGLDYRPPPAAEALAAKPAGTPAPFADRTDPSGLAAFGLGAPAQVPPPPGGSVALGDLDGDGAVDAVVVRFEAGRGAFRTLVLRNDGRARFREAAAGIDPGFARGAALGDFDGDGRVDLALVAAADVRLLRNAGAWRFEDVTARAGLEAGRGGLSATFVDFDHDGDLDLFVAASPASRLLRNNGNSTFTDVTAALGAPGLAAGAVGLVAADLDNDRDIDLVLLPEAGPPRIFGNERAAGFREVTAAGTATAAEAGAVTVADLDRDGAMDLVLPGRRGGAVLLANRGDGTFKVDARSPDLGSALPGGAFGCGAVDFDLDGDLDLYLFGREGGALFENAGDGRFVFAGALPAPRGGRAAAAADFDGDGRPDILYVDGAGSPRLLGAAARPGRHWLGVRLEGLRSNKSGLGAKIEIRAGALYQKLEVSGHNGWFSQDSPVVWLGLGEAERADSVTVRWPSGILQSEIQVAADRVVTIKELDRKGTSCPLLYAWNGREFALVTDFLGGSAIGMLEGPGRYSVPDTDEYVKIPGASLAPSAGRYRLRLNNQLEETIFFDRAELLVVDHPAGTEIEPNERLMPAPPFPEFRIHTATDPRLPLAARDDAGRDVLGLLAEVDRRYPDGFRLLPFKGYAETHALELDLGDVARAKKVLLLGDAWIDYADSSSNLAASQARLAQVPPYLQARDCGGTWRTVVPSLGFPAGLPKTLAVDLGGKFPCGDGRVRIVTNMRIYWDRIRVDTSPAAPVRVRRLDPIRADLGFRGFPAYYSPDGRLPWLYDYRRIRATETWGVHAGAYTRFGDVRPLLLARDDRFVVTRNGDEIALEFPAAAPPAPGWTRDFLLYADGYGKDMDLNSLHADVVGPLPFHAMSRFPYPGSERYPDDEAHRAYAREYNTRVFPVDPAGRGRPRR